MTCKTQYVASICHRCQRCSTRAVLLSTRKNFSMATPHQNIRIAHVRGVGGEFRCNKSRPVTGNIKEGLGSVVRYSDYFKYRTDSSRASQVHTLKCKAIGPGSTKGLLDSRTHIHIHVYHFLCYHTCRRGHKQLKHSLLPL